MNKAKKLIFFLLALFPLGVGFIGSLLTEPAINSWYQGLIKPSINPSNEIFAPVWTFLFILMGISFYLVLINKSNKGKRESVIVFIVQLVLNLTWSFLFFFLKRPDLAFFEIIVLWVAILCNIIEFKKISRLASYLLFPYLAWVSFALILNFLIMRLNS